MAHAQAQLRQQQTSPAGRKKVQGGQRQASIVRMGKDMQVMIMTIVLFTLCLTCSQL